MGDGALIKLEVPETEMAAILRLQPLSGQVFKVTIEPGENSER